MCTPFQLIRGKNIILYLQHLYCAVNAKIGRKSCLNNMNNLLTVNSGRVHVLFSEIYQAISPPPPLWIPVIRSGCSQSFIRDVG